MLQFRETKVSRDPAHNSSTSPDVTTLASEIPSRRVQQLRSQVDHGNLGDVVGGTTDTGAQSSKAHRRRLGNDGVGDWSKSAGVDKGDDDPEDGLGVVGCAALLDGRAHAEDEEESDVGGCAPEVDGSTTEPGSQRPGENVGDELQTRIDQVELERSVGVNASFCMRS